MITLNKIANKIIVDYVYVCFYVYGITYEHNIKAEVFIHVQKIESSEFRFHDSPFVYICLFARFLVNITTFAKYVFYK